MKNVMRTLAASGEFIIWQDLSGSILMNGHQFESAVDAARSVRDYPEVCADLMQQVFEKLDGYVDGETATAHLKAEVDPLSGETL